jgi:hypothetical protein
MKTSTKIQFCTAFFLLLFGTTSCFDEMFIDGNGISKTEFRRAEGFDEIVSSGDFKVIVMPGSAYSVEVTAESNLLPYISTNVDGKALKIRTSGVHSLRQNSPIVISITTPVLKGLSLSGSGLIQTGSFLSTNFSIELSGSGDIDTKISCDAIKANVSGSGTILIQGETSASNFAISGSGKIKTYNLLQKQCQATISGSGDMYLNVSQTIDARISGSGRVYFVNHPVIHSSISGSGNVVDKN